MGYTGDAAERTISLACDARRWENRRIESVLRNANNIAGDDRRSLEHVLGSQLADHQQILIQVLDIDGAQPEETRRAAVAGAAAIAERGRAHATEQASVEEADETIDEAIRQVRQRPAT